MMQLTRKRIKKIHASYTLEGTDFENIESIKYLGVTITSDLRWNTHVSNAYTKANRTLGFLRRNLYSCPQGVKEAAYKGLVRPVVGYGNSVWDPPGVLLQEELESVQKRAARFVTGNYNNETGSMPLLKSKCIHKMSYNTGSGSAGLYSRGNKSKGYHITLDPELLNKLILKMSYNTESRSAGAFIPQKTHPQDSDQQEPLSAKMFIPEETDPQDAILLWILTSRSLYSRGNASTSCHITLNTDEQGPLYQLNLISRMLYNTGSRSAGAFIPVEPDQQDVI